MQAKSLQLCLTLCNPMNCGPPDSSVHGILQARILEWVAKPSSGASSPPRDQTSISYVSCIGRQVLYQQSHLESLLEFYHGGKNTTSNAYRVNHMLMIAKHLNMGRRSNQNRFLGKSLIWEPKHLRRTRQKIKTHAFDTCIFHIVPILNNSFDLFLIIIIFLLISFPRTNFF